MYMKKFILLTLMFFYINVYSNDTTMIERPYYVIDYSAAACKFEIRINDIPVFSYEVRGQTGTELPINNLIPESGLQTVNIRILPLEDGDFLDKNADFSFSILLYDVSDGFIFKKKFEKYKSAPVTSDIPSIVMEETFEAEVPYKLDAWQHSKDLRKVENLKEKVLKVYNHLYELLKNKNYEAFRKIIYQREYNAAISMHLSKEASADRVEGLIKDCENGYEIDTIPEDVFLIFEANGKMVKLVDIDGDPAIFFFNEEEEMMMGLEIHLHMKKGCDVLEVI